ncbi:hypothetical protein ACFXB3_01390 [Streptomyces sp. NPDC059447]|uniref:hypothetical protein n=1 Tax=Streptomyces sp. NPDC059447 TaxID=3346834 RepID=UPI00368CA8A5
MPRRLPLVPALLDAATLAPYGVVGIGYLALVTAGVATMRSDDFDSAGDALPVGWIGMAAFAVYGVAARQGHLRMSMAVETGTATIPQTARNPPTKRTTPSDIPRAAVCRSGFRSNPFTTRA